MKGLGTWIGPGSLAGIVALAGCGPPFTTATGSTGTGASGSGGAPASSSTTTGSTGGGSTSSGTTSPCTPGLIDGCGPGLYCNAAKACDPCANAVGMSFGAPQAIALPSMTVTATALFPRVEKKTQALFFLYGDGGSVTGQIVQAPPGAGQGSWGQWAYLPAPFDLMSLSPPPEQDGPLPWPDGTEIQGVVDTSKVSAMYPVVLFGSKRSGDELLYAANLEPPPASVSASALKAPFISGDSGIAVAFEAAPTRYFWLRDGQVMTATGTGAAPVALNITFDGGCVPPAGAVADPWVGPDGGRLLFSATYYEKGGSGCMPAPGSPARPFHVDLDATGQPKGAATQVFTGDATDNDRTPSLSPDGCLLLFARGDASTGQPVLYEALRE